MQVRKLLIDVNPYSLKGAGCRILTLLTGLDDVTHDLGKLARAVERPETVGLCPASNNRLCNLKSKPFFPIISYHLRQFLHRRPCEPLGRRFATRRVHPHVERTVRAETEAARRIVHLRRRHAQIQQHARHPPYSARIECALHRRETVMDDLEPRILDALGRLDRARILVERDQPSRVAQAREHRAAMAAAPERAVDIHAVGPRHERIDRFIQQHRAMLEFVSHRGRLPHRNQNVKFFSASGMPCAIAACSFAV
ncbi:hypothetical protein DM50_2652 [Burkholderia mallei]|nr:hypothetical protein DM50_2652 [Burkholderia mallei]